MAWRLIGDSAEDRAGRGGSCDGKLECAATGSSVEDVSLPRGRARVVESWGSPEQSFRVVTGMLWRGRKRWEERLGSEEKTKDYKPEEEQQPRETSPRNQEEKKPRCTLNYLVLVLVLVVPGRETEVRLPWRVRRGGGGGWRSKVVVGAGEVQKGRESGKVARTCLFARVQVSAPIYCAESSTDTLWAASALPSGCCAGRCWDDALETLERQQEPCNRQRTAPGPSRLSSLGASAAHYGSRIRGHVFIVCIRTRSKGRSTLCLS